MPFITFPQTALVELIYDQHGETMENTLYVFGLDDWTPLQLEVLCGEVADWWAQEMPTYVSNTVTLNTVRARDMSTQFGYVAEITPTTGNIGERVSPALPSGSTMAIKFITGLAGRRNRGRNYFVGLCEDQVTGNAIIDARRDEIVGAYGQLPIALTTNGAVHVVASRAAPVGTPPVGDVNPVTSYAADGFVDSQRRRLAGRGS